MIRLCLMLLASLALAAPAFAQWTNPNPTSAVSVAIMVNTGATGAVQGPKTVSGFTSVGSDRFVAEELMLNAVLIDEWSDIGGPSILNVGQYVTGAGSVTAPAAPYANILYSGSAQTFYFARAKGVNGVLVTNDANGNMIVDGGNPTGTVDALFPPQTTDVTRFYYRSFTAPYNVTYVDLLRTTNGYLLFDGTNFSPRTTVAVGDATNAVLFAGQLPGYYLDFFNQTNVQIWDDGVLDAADVMGFESGVNADWELVTRTNGGRTSTVARLNIAGGSNDLGRLASSNAWTEFNSFEDDVYFFQRLIRTGNGITLGDGATVSSTASNLTASGSQSTIAGGFSSSASGTRSTVGGGYNNGASGSGSTIGGGQNSSAGDYSAVGGGDNIDVTGQYSAGPGGLNVSATKNYELVYGRNLASTNADGLMFAWGDVETNRLKSIQDRAVVFLWEGTNRGRMGFNTANPTANVHVTGSVMADQYYGAFLGDISGASGAPVASNSQFTLEGPGGTNAQTRRLVFTGAAVTNIVVNGFTTTVYFADTLGGGGGAVNFTSTWSVAATLSSTNATMLPIAAGVFYATCATCAPSFVTVSAAGALAVTSNFSDVNNAATARSNLGLGNAATNSIAQLDNTFVSHTGETNALNFTNAASVKGPTPSAANDLATKGYVDTASSAAVTNAVDSATVNGTDYTGLGHITFTDAGVSSAQAGSTLVVTRVWAGPAYLSTGTNNTAPTNAANTFGLADIGQTIGGGVENASTNANYATIGGGRSSTIAAGATHATISGGQNNDVSAAATHSTVSGGYDNDVEGSCAYSCIGGGQANKVKQASGHGTIAGGKENIIGNGSANTAYSGIGSGSGNKIIDGQSIYACIGGGLTNKIDALGVDCWGAVIAGGDGNMIRQRGYGGSIGGGVGNQVSNYWGTIPGGADNLVAGTYGFAAGRHARALHSGAFVWGDNQATDFDSTATNQFLIRASGSLWVNDDGTLNIVSGTRFVTNVDPKAFTPVRQGVLMYDVGSNLTYLAEAGTTNDWVKSAVWTAAP